MRFLLLLLRACTLAVGRKSRRRRRTHQTMDHTIGKHATGTQRFRFGPQHLTVEDQSYRFVVGQFGGKMSSDQMICEIRELAEIEYSEIMFYFETFTIRARHSDKEVYFDMK